MRIFRKEKKMAAIYTAAVLCVASTGWAATSHWNDASAIPQQMTQTSVNKDTNWQQWKENWKTIGNNYEQVSLAPGRDSSKLNFGWYSREQADRAEVRVAKQQDMKQAKLFSGNSAAGTVVNGVTYYSNKVEVEGLTPETTYWYQVNLNGKWQKEQQFHTGNPDDFFFMYVGDPQIGASIGQVSAEGAKQDGELATCNDAYNWNKTLNGALSQHPEINFLVSPGDQINEPAADHKALIEKAVKAYPKAKWRVVVMHQDIYGSGLDHSDSDGILLRTQLTPIYDANHIDVVLQGHDHTYARTYQLSSDGGKHADFAEYRSNGQSGQQHNMLDTALKNKDTQNYYASQNLCYTIADMNQGTLVNPKGVFYMSANSATGSKYYELIPQQQDYIAARSQTWRPTYSVVHITADAFSIDTYDVMSGTPIDDTYRIIKQ
ncbi:fibronectin type III domain-containing protein [Pectinatus frisingensis]|uniref:fibronectin type III domain-containing protein n=1 Tax=Pectinatus frisingensis TaxID=865 RepID=UPI001E64BEB2|nr:fibronectin type III domain-containing protein [Pectinatus frisingensis]